MKNQTLISYLIPTEDASPLYLYEGKLDVSCVEGGIKSLSKDCINKHLYLCSTLPIKEGEYYIDSNGEVVKLKKIDVHINQNSWKKILFTTDPNIVSDFTFGTEPSAISIDGNTKATISYLDYIEGEKDYRDYYEVNFLTEFCKRWNDKDNQKVDVEKLAIEKYSLTLNTELTSPQKIKVSAFIDGFKSNQALQNTGRFSLVDMKLMAIQVADWKDGKLGNFYNGKNLHHVIDDFIQSKYHPKGDIVIECEMEEYPLNACKACNENGVAHCAYPEECGQIKIGTKIKLNKDGQPTLTFK